MNIVKLLNGNVVLTNASGDIEKVFVNVNALDVKGSDEVIVKFGFNQWHSLFASQIQFYEVKPIAPKPFSGNANDLVDILMTDFFFELSGGGGDDLATVLTAGNSAGANDINMNGNDLLNVNEITSAGDLFLNPVGSIDANGKNINMTGGEIHNVPLIHSQNNTDLTIEGKGTGDVILKTNNANKLTITDNTGITYGTYADLNGQDIKNLNNASGKNNTDLTVEALGTGDIVFKTNNVDRLKITDTGTFIGLPDPAGWTYIVKSANQDVTNNSTLQDDTEFQFSVVAGGHYMAELDIVISANNTTGDYKNAFAVSAGTMKAQGIIMTNTNLAIAQITNINSISGTITNAVTIGTSTADIDMLLFIKILFSFTASANATLKYQFANNSAGAGNISRTWKGSILKYKRID